MQCSFTKPNSTSMNNTSERQTTENKKRAEGLQVRRLFCDGKIEGYFVYNQLSKDTN